MLNYLYGSTIASLNLYINTVYRTRLSRKFYI